jgi:hypothetical protein
MGSSLSLEKLFYTKKGKGALFQFLSRIKIATKKWLRAAGSLEVTPIRVLVDRL